ncbi:hypothetical protein BHE74_00058223 [Ensete ventricosum]|nr:hypothetical protein BHE74_00058223 [Ensete ventricosum]
MGGPAIEGDSTSTLKAYARAVVKKRPRHRRDPKITFRFEGEEYPNYGDALVILVQIANARIKRIMIDTGIGRSEDDAVGNSSGVRRGLAESIGSLPGWRKGVHQKKTETRRKIIGGLDDAMGARGEFARTSPKVLGRSLGTRREIAGGGP